MTTGPPWVLSEPVVTVIRPFTPDISTTLPPMSGVDIGVPWPRCRVTGAEPPRPPRVIRVAVPPQGPWRLPLPPVVRDLLACPLPARRKSR